MKIRNGFVSNSSSSSFIIEHWDIPKDDKFNDVSCGDIANWVEETFKTWKKNQLKNAKQIAKRHREYWLKELPESKVRTLDEFIQSHKEWVNNINLERFADNVSVRKIKDLPLEEQEELHYWYAKKNLEKENIIIEADDNYFPESIMKRIVQEFDIPQERYNTHMG